MFLTIFKHEINYWLKKPAFYIYIILFFTLSLFTAASSAGIFDFLTITTGSSNIVNSPSGVTGLINGLTVLIFFLFPSIIGASIYRDYKSEIHTILYSYPFSKANYLFAKFFSAVIIVVCILLTISIGLLIGFRLPGTNPDLVGPFSFITYVQSYFVYIIPNVLLFGAIVFAVVTFSRNVTAGFITIILLMLIQGIVSGVLASNEDTRYLAGLLDPYGAEALNYYTRYWTVAEQNEQLLPIKDLIIYNRLLWLSVASLVFGLVYKYFKFSQNALSFSFKKRQPERATKNNFGNIIRVTLPKVAHVYSLKQNLKVTWKLSNIDFKYILKSLPFIAIVLVGFIFTLLNLWEVGQLFGTKTLPVTWRVLANSTGFLGFFIYIITFLYSGTLIHRGKISKINHLTDSTPIHNWVLLVSKFIAIIKIQLALLTMLMVAGICFQTFNGFYDFEIWHYLYELFVLNLVSFIIWTLLSFFVQTLVKNQYLGLFILLLIFIGIPLLSLAGIEQSIYKYNQGPGYSYSDMNGYQGSALHVFFTYKLYWLCIGIVFLISASLFWVRGIPNSFKERLKIAKFRFKGVTAVVFIIFLIGFLSLGATIYYENNIVNTRISAKESEQLSVDWEKTYKTFENAAQPRIVAVNVNMDIYPNERNYRADGTYVMVNKTDQIIDSLFVNYNHETSTLNFDKTNELVTKDTVYNFHIYKLKNALMPGDTLGLTFEVKNRENTFFRRRSPVIKNGTFINNQLFPSFGYNGGRELRDNKTREKYELPPNELRPHPSDSSALGNTYISKDADWIDFEATVSTSEDQIAIAPGYLQKEWVKDGRRYFHYKMDSKILNFYAFNSARYEVKKELWNDVNLEIYYHKGHDYNLDRMMAGMKSSLAYNANEFSSYQHKQARIIEFPRTAGSFAQSFPNTIPFSETIGFIADVNDNEDGGVDYPFAVTAHEIAHQWWAHQVIGADVLGATMLSESMSEYASLKVLEQKHGKHKMRKFLKDALDSYLRSRTFETKRENPLMYNDGQGYIRYQKGSLIFYALSDYIGEENLNNALSKYVEKVKFQEPPYTTSIDMVNYIKAATPDSLQYIIKDMFETVTLYKNRVVSTNSKKLDNGTYEVEIEFEVSKYRNNDLGKRYYGDVAGDTLSYKTASMKRPILSVKLNDYIDIGAFDDDDNEIYLKKHRITKIHNTIKIILDKAPKEVGIDPYNKLIDTNSSDNRKELSN